MIASTYDNNLVPLAPSGSFYQAQPDYQAQSTSQVLNNYTKEYLNTVKENRSKYGSFVDNALTYDPYKEQKSVYNVVHETADYFPWGKPGAGAPKLDGDTGQLKTKLSGSLKWNLNGETAEDRAKRLLKAQRTNTNTNLLLYKKAPNQQAQNAGGSSVGIGGPAPKAAEPTVKYALPPISRQATTYSYNLSDHFAVPSIPFENSSVVYAPAPAPAPQLSQPNEITFSNASFSTQNSIPIMPIEREAHIRSFERSFVDRPAPAAAPAVANPLAANSWASTASSHNLKEKPNELTKLSKLYVGNQPSVDSPSNPYWFGRAGRQVTYVDDSGNPPKAAAYSYDVRRRKLLDTLESRTSPTTVVNWSTSNAHNLYGAKREVTSLKPSQSNHRNSYENEMKMTS